jgi:hypothetical protein
VAGVEAPGDGRLPPRTGVERVAVGGTYFGLAVLLLLAMSATHIDRGF